MSLWDFALDLGGDILSTAGNGNAWLGAANLAYTGYTAYQQYQQAGDYEAAGQLALQAAQKNKEIALFAARDKVRIRQDELIKDIGTIRARYGASGVRVDQGAPLLAIEESISNAEQDIKVIKQLGKMGADAALIQGYESNLEAEVRASGAKYDAGRTLLTTGLKIGGELAIK